MAWHDLRTWAALIAALVVAAACQASPTPGPTPPTSPSPTPLESPSAPAPTPVGTIGRAEGALQLLVLPGYAERGENDGAYDWVGPFEDESGCMVTAVEVGSAEQIVSGVREEGGAVWDGVLAPGDAALGLIAEGLIQPIDAETLFADWPDLWPPLQNAAHDTVAEVHYGVAQGWRPNLLMWNADAVQPAPVSWSAAYDPASPLIGRITAHDSPISIADAALYLSFARPDLEIVDPYSLTQAQFDAVVDLLAAQRPNVGSYWATPLDEISDFREGVAVLGTGWPGQLRILQEKDPPIPVEATLPLEGATAAADSWMLVAGARHPGCMLRWMEWMLRPEIQQQAAEYVAQAPANVAACPLLDEQPGPFGFTGFCDFHHATDDTFVGRLHFWRTPLADCGLGGSETCVDHGAWLQRWEELKAAG